MQASGPREKGSDVPTLITKGTAVISSVSPAQRTRKEGRDGREDTAWGTDF